MRKAQRRGISARAFMDTFSSAGRLTLPAETFDQMNARIKAEMKAEDVEMGVETFDCVCGAKWNKRGNTMRHGRCTCGRDVFCACGVNAAKHFDGWDGNALDCEEAARR